MDRPLRNYFIALWIFCFFGLIFSGVSTFDFINHLDRQQHAITCSYIPGMGSLDAAGSSGCHTVMMSPYSSVFRANLWGGIPISLPAFGVFAYLLWRSIEIYIRKREQDGEESRYLLAALGLPVMMTVLYFGISAAIIGAVCKLCVGIYISSVGGFVTAFLIHRINKRMGTTDEEGAYKAPPWNVYAIYFLEGVAFVIIPLILYVALQPTPSPASQNCGSLLHPADKYAVRVPLGRMPGGVSTLEILDPLCPACKAFSQRLDASDLKAKLDLEAILFPLDTSCNWMISQSLHPGACAVSEAILCAGDQAHVVVDWAFMEQETLRAMAESNPIAVYDRIKQQFPNLATCVNTPEVRTRLNKSLRWAVSNSLPVLTPQLYINHQKICDEDTDLGLEFTLTRRLASQGGRQ